ncbi:hypothetical protein ABIE67_009543 [Streptomyces sp. V4I8]
MGITGKFKIPIIATRPGWVAFYGRALRVRRVPCSGGLCRRQGGSRPSQRTIAGMNVPHMAAPGTARIDVLSGSFAVARAVHACLASHHRLVSALEQQFGLEDTHWRFFVSVSGPAASGDLPGLAPGPPRGVTVRVSCLTKAQMASRDVV